MAFQAYEDTNTQFPEVPFLTEFPGRTKSDGTLYTVNSIYLSEKGIMAFTHCFKVFIWKSEKLHNELLERIGSTLDGVTTMPCFSIQTVKATKKGFVAGFDDSLEGTWTEDGKFYSFTLHSPVPSDTPIPGLDVPKQIDTSAQTGRKAR